MRRRRNATRSRDYYAKREPRSARTDHPDFVASKASPRPTTIVGPQRHHPARSTTIADAASGSSGRSPQAGWWPKSPCRKRFSGHWKVPGSAWGKNAVVSYLCSRLGDCGVASVCQAGAGRSRTPSSGPQRTPSPWILLLESAAGPYFLTIAFLTGASEPA